MSGLGFLRRLLGEEKATATTSTTPIPRSVDLLWDEGQRRLAAQSELVSRLDSKTTPLLGFGVAAIAFFQTTVSRLGEDPSRLGSALAALGLLSTLAVMYPRTFNYAPRFRAFLRDGNRRPQEARTLYLGNIRTAIKTNEVAFEIKTVWFKVAVWIYTVAILLAVAATIGAHG